MAKGFAELGYNIVATEGTAGYLQAAGLTAAVVGKVHEQRQDIINMIKAGQINMVINTLTHGKEPETDGFKIRRAAVEHAVPCLTALDTVREVLRVIKCMRRQSGLDVRALQDYVESGNGCA